ncbi:unnamed protein product [Blepharisma stoltei]|uniref:Uncharacterized protein n=1 Tax=Blepharisma stoltei TaxID=1481888 RepID=A0AAU9KDI4_9CILI|nr:unnamed protein product [Blepharisma stoltei]
MEYAQKYASQSQQISDEILNSGISHSLNYRQTVFKKTNHITEKIHEEIQKLNKSMDEKNNANKIAYKQPRKVSPTNPSQTLFQAYAKVSKHKPRRYKNSSVDNDYDFADLLEEKCSSHNSSSLDIQASSYPLTPLNPELEAKLRVIDYFSKNEKNHHRHHRQYSSPRTAVKIRKKTPVKINGMQFPNLSVLLVQEENKAKCNNCRHTNCKCTIQGLDKTATEWLNNKKDMRKKLLDEIQIFVKKNDTRQRSMRSLESRICSNKSMSPKKEKNSCPADR